METEKLVVGQIRVPLKELDYNIPPPSNRKEEKSEEVKGRWKRLAREVAGGITNHIDMGLENMVNLGSKRGTQQAAGMTDSAWDEGGGKKSRSNICPQIYAQNSPKVGVASLEWPQVNK